MCNQPTILIQHRADVIIVVRATHSSTHNFSWRKPPDKNHPASRPRLYYPFTQQIIPPPLRVLFIRWSFQFFFPTIIKFLSHHWTEVLMVYVAVIQSQVCRPYFVPAPCAPSTALMIPTESLAEGNMSILAPFENIVLVAVQPPTNLCSNHSPISI